MQLLLYTPVITARLQYIGDFIFKEVLLLDWRITNDENIFNDFTGPKIMYVNTGTSPDHFTIGAHGLLSEQNITDQDIRCFETNNFTAFFQTTGADIDFDIFSAAFYLLSRYEEYLPHKKDIYGRYAHENSLAFKENFLRLPLVNTWILYLAKALEARFPGFFIHPPPFNFVPTYDIDMAYSYRHKGWLRNTGSFLKAPSADRLQVLLANKRDPFDCYDWLDELHRRHHLAPIYFFLMAEKNKLHDKNILPQKTAMQELIKRHSKKYSTGIHPSWQSGDHPELVKKERVLLEAITATPVHRSRQHFIRFNLPAGYRQLLESGITDDYSMGYGSINGFRASVASSFYWFDLERNKVTSLRIHPFCFMDANSFYEQHSTPQEALHELLQYYLVCKQVQGQLITVWHNNFLGTDPLFAGWRNCYDKLISQLSEDGNL